MTYSYDELIDKVDGFDALSAIEQVKYVSYFYTLINEVADFNSTVITQVFISENISRPSNVTDCLNKLVIRTPAILLKRNNSYSFHRTVKKNLDEQFLGKKHVRETSVTLRKLLNKVTSPEQKLFLEEAITCYEVKATRAAIVMTWLLTVDILYEYTLKHKLSDFNTAMSKNTKYKTYIISKKEDFNDLKENDFIELLGSASIITKDQKKILVEKLGTRNTAAHPNSIDMREAKVISYIEDLVPNIISKFQ